MANELTPFIKWFTPAGGTYQQGLQADSLKQARQAGLGDQKIRELLGNSGATAVGKTVALELRIGAGDKPLFGEDFARVASAYRPAVDYNQIYQDAFSSARGQFDTRLSGYEKELQGAQDRFRNLQGEYDKELQGAQDRFRNLQGEYEKERGTYQSSLAEWERKYSTKQGEFEGLRSQLEESDRQRRIQTELSVNQQLSGLRSGRTPSGSGVAVIGSGLGGQEALRRGDTASQSSGSVLGRYLEKIRAIDDEPVGGNAAAAGAPSSGGAGKVQLASGGASSARQYYSSRFS
jgi:hypothetical protein